MYLFFRFLGILLRKKLAFWGKTFFSLNSLKFNYIKKDGRFFSNRNKYIWKLGFYFKYIWILVFYFKYIWILGFYFKYI